MIIVIISIVPMMPSLHIRVVCMKPIGDVITVQPNLGLHCSDNDGDEDGDDDDEENDDDDYRLFSPQIHRQRCRWERSELPRTSWSGGSCGSSHSWSGSQSCHWSWLLWCWWRGWPEDSLAMEKVSVGLIWWISSSCPSVTCAVWHVHVPENRDVQVLQGFVVKSLSSVIVKLLLLSLTLSTRLLIRTNSHGEGWLDRRKRIRSLPPRSLLCPPCKGGCQSPGSKNLLRRSKVIGNLLN